MGGKVSYQLRPLSFSELLDRALWIYRDNFLLLTATRELYRSPGFFIPHKVTFAANPVAATLSLLPFLIFYPLAGALMIGIVAQLCVGDRLSLAEALRSLRPVWVRILGFNWLAHTMYMIVFTTGLGMFAIIKPILEAELFGALVFAVLLVVIFASFAFAVYFFVGWSFGSIALMVEHPPRWSALHRSRGLIRGVWWKTALMVAGVNVFSFLSYHVLHIFWAGVPGLRNFVVSATLSVFETYISVLFVIYYFDRRCRTEDFDLRLLAEQVRADTRPMVPAEQSA